MKTNILKQIKVLLIAGILFIHLSCSQAEKSFSYDAESIAMEETGETVELNSVKLDDKKDLKVEKENIDEQLKIIKNANCRIKVQNVEEVTLQAKLLTSKYRGYVSDERFTNTNYSKENRFTIRVPQDNFDQVLNGICDLAEFVDYKNITTTNVTEEYIDVTSRLKTKLEIKERYESILRAKAKTVEDVLMTEAKLGELQEEIEAAQGRLNYLTNKISYSTIQLDVYQTVIPNDEPVAYIPSFVDRAGDGLSFGWDIVKHLVLLLFYGWPLLFLGVLIFTYFKWIRK